MMWTIGVSQDFLGFEILCLNYVGAVFFVHV